MRLDRLTNQLQVALSDAQSLAVGHDHNFIEPEHLLLAMVDQQGSSAIPILTQSGANVRKLRAALKEKLTNMTKVTNNGGDVHTSSDLVRTLNLADKHAQQHGDKFISSEAVLMAMLAHKGSVASY